MRRHDNVPSFEIYNEENVAQWWDGTPAAYADVLRRGIAAVRAGNPEAEVLLGGMVFPDVNWLRAICGAGGPGRLVDIIPFHAYCRPRSNRRRAQRPPRNSRPPTAIRRRPSRRCAVSFHY
jgi:hypothetical protein